MTYVCAVNDVEIRSRLQSYSIRIMFKELIIEHLSSSAIIPQVCRAIDSSRLYFDIL